MKTTLADLNDKQLAMLPKEQRAKLGKSARTYAEAQSDAAHKSEREMQQMIRAFLEQKGWFYVWQQFGRKASGKKGQPDFVICVPVRLTCVHGTFYRHGLFVAIECKMPGFKPTEEQVRAIQSIHWTHGLTLVATSAKMAIDFLIELSK
jgi:hypothetical protein